MFDIRYFFGVMTYQFVHSDLLAEEDEVGCVFIHRLDDEFLVVETYVPNLGPCEGRFWL